MFGYNVDYDEFINTALSGIKKIPNYIYGKQLLIELYETQFGIYDHRTSTNPLSSVRFNEAEQYLDNFLYDEYLSIFVYKEIGKKLGMSFDDFLNRPKYEINKILKIIEEVDAKKSETYSNVLNDLDSVGKKIKKSKG